MRKILGVIAILSLVVSAFAVERWALDSRIRKLTLKFEQMQRKAQKRIPTELLRRAQGIILLERTKAGFIFAFEGGNGIAMMRQPISGQWGAVSFVRANEASLGAQIGGRQSFVVMLCMTTNACQMLTQPNVEIGGEASGTARDQSAGVEGVFSSHEEPIYIFGDREGLYGGAALKAGAVRFDGEANISYYGKAAGARDILFNHNITPTDSVRELARTLDQSANSIAVISPPPPVTTNPQTNTAPQARPAEGAIEHLQLLMAELDAHHQTNALQHLNAYLSDMVSSRYATDADTALALLERLRSYKTAEAIDLLEFQLDGAVVGLGDALRPVPAEARSTGALQTLQRSRDYRNRFPMEASDVTRRDQMKRAWNLLQKN